MKTKFGIKEVVAIGIGTALFVALTEIQIPIGIPNTYLQPRMAILAFFAAVFGPLAGMPLKKADLMARPLLFLMLRRWQPM